MLAGRVRCVGGSSTVSAGVGEQRQFSAQSGRAGTGAGHEYSVGPSDAFAARVGEQRQRGDEAGNRSGSRCQARSRAIEHQRIGHGCLPSGAGRGVQSDGLPEHHRLPERGGSGRCGTQPVQEHGIEIEIEDRMACEGDFAGHFLSIGSAVLFGLPG
jgi:hypothetical protein